MNAFKLDYDLYQKLIYLEDNMNLKKYWLKIEDDKILLQTNNEIIDLKNIKIDNEKNDSKK